MFDPDMGISGGIAAIDFAAGAFVLFGVLVALFCVGWGAIHIIELWGAIMLV